MDIKDVVKAAAIAKIEYIDKEVEWNGYSFTVAIKSAETAADFEFVYLKNRTDEDAITARRVHRHVLFDGEQMPYEQAKTLEWSFLTAICSKINEVQKDGEEKKPSAPKTNSGTT